MSVSPPNEPRDATASAAYAPLLLVVDDEPDIRELMSEALVAEGYRVVEAKHGVEALDQIAEEEPQLILLDMRMPVMDGWSFSEVLRERQGRQIPVVVVTAAKNAEERAAEVRADTYLGKPFDLQQLYDVVTQTLAGRGAIR